MINCIGYEVLFSKYLKILQYKNIEFIDYIGYEGNISVRGGKIKE